MGRPEEAKDKYERALEMRVLLLETDTKSSVYQSQVATTLNNLGALHSYMERPDEAREKYERAFKIRKSLLETNPKSSVYQSDVATTLNNLGNLLSDMGRLEEAVQHYQKSLQIFTEPMQYLTIQAKARAIINIIQLVSRCAQENTNIIHRSKYFKKVYDVYKQHDFFFSEYELVHERRLVKKAGLGAHIQYLMINAGIEKNSGKRICEYEKCILEVEQIAEVEDDEKLKELWSSVTYYLKGRLFVNRAMQSKPPDSELMKKAIEQFKYAKENYQQAEVCYCIYTVLLELEGIEAFTDETKSRMNGLLKNAIKNLPEKMEGDVKPAFMEIEALLENRSVKTGAEISERLNCCITKIDYYALRDHFNYISQKIATYFKEPFSPNVSYSNWKLIVTFDEPEKVQGKLTIKAGNRVLFDEPLGMRNLISLKHRSEMKNETITFITEKGRNVKGEITYSEIINSDDGLIDVQFLEHNCKRPSTDGNFNIAIVQLKYHLKKTGPTHIIEDNKAYFRKVTAILDAVRGKANLVVFPEFSIPFSYLSAMKQYSNDNGIAIAAGSHYVTDDNLKNYGEMFEHEFGDNDLLKNISPVIIPSSKRILHTEKILGGKVERDFLSSDGMTHGTLNRIFRLNDDVIFGVMVCYDFLHNSLRAHITDACNIILVPQTNKVPKRFHEVAQNEIDNPSVSGNKAYIMASGIFTYDDGNSAGYDDKNIMGGDSGVILTLDKDLYKCPGKPILKSTSEQVIMLASLNMDFFAARDTQMAQVPLRTQFIHIFEESEILKSAKDEDKDDVPAFFELLEKMKSCTDRSELKELLEDNDSLISRYSPFMHKSIGGGLTSLPLEKIRKKCSNIVLR
jgi:tetratricopeptide (TPR) repeat protein/predicted amidohydrolase